MTLHLRDGQESCDVGLKVTYFGEFAYLNMYSSCIRIKYYSGYVFEFIER